MTILVLGAIALGLGVYIGLGWPGLPWGKADRVLPGSMRRRRRYFTPLDLLRRHERKSRR